MSSEVVVPGHNALVAMTKFYEAALQETMQASQLESISRRQTEEQLRLAQTELANLRIEADSLRSELARAQSSGELDLPGVVPPPEPELAGSSDG